MIALVKYTSSLHFLSFNQKLTKLHRVNRKAKLQFAQKQKTSFEEKTNRLEKKFSIKKNVK